MNLAVISVLLQELLFDNQRITLPGVGTFSLEEIPASFLEDSNIMLPPTKKIVFDNTQIKNDGLLENAYARKTGLILEDSKRDLLFLSKKVKEAISNELKVVIPGFGALYNSKGEIAFEKDSDFDIAPDSFGLDAIIVEPNEFPEYEAPSHNDTETENVEFDLTDIYSGVEKIKEAEQSEVEQSEIEQFEPEEQQESNLEPQMLSELQTEQQQKAPVVKEENKQEDKAVTIVMKILIFLVVLLLIVLLCVIFKEQLASVLKHILYTKEELEIIEKWATL